ncbi:MAG: hypothetical protein ABI876_04505 [Bacteroidota bacterium]
MPKPSLTTGSRLHRNSTLPPVEDVAAAEEMQTQPTTTTGTEPTTAPVQADHILRSRATKPAPSARVKAEKTALPPRAKKPTRERWTVFVTPDLIEQTKRAAEFGTFKGRRQSIAAIVDRALRNEIAAMEKEHGGLFPPIDEETGE